MGKPIFNPYGMDPGFRYTYDPYQNEQSSLSVNCPKCGKEVFYDSKNHDMPKCPECGGKIEWAMAVSDQDRKALRRKTRIKRILFAAGCVILLLAWFFLFVR